VPEFVTLAIGGKRVALVALSPEYADEVCAALGKAKARPCLFEASDSPASEAIQSCDLVIFHVRPETMESEWLKPGARATAIKHLIFAGEQNDLFSLPPDVRSRAVDFLTGHAEPLEILSRLAFVATRPAMAEPAKEEAKPALAPAAPQGRSRLSVSRPKIVIADDDGIIRAMVGPTLQNYGMNCRVADNGLDALTLIRTEQPHVAVLDVNMPGMEGYEVLAAVRAENLPTRVILLTARQQEQDVLKAFDLGADDYLIKPFNPFELVARVKRLLR
jgi:CheY-like chemotaxis protein